MTSKSLTKGIFHLALAKQYLDDWRRSVSGLDKYLAKKCIDKIDCTLNDVYSAMTNESREQYLKEVKQADILVYDEIFSSLLMMDEKQRELLETIANGIIKGELIEYVE